ncbi:MAG: STN domain-containing protein [Opitutaceae bacterium]|nr:STN domain-containing protein [Opitutaceae bacterium]
MLGLLCCLWAASAWAGEPTPDATRDYDLKGGEAAVMLKKFARQARCQLLFDADQVQGIETAALKGRYTAKAALEWMLADTALQIREDRASGAFAIVHVAIPPPRIIELPPYVVEETQGEPWRYAAAPGVEVISQVSDENTRKLLDQDRRLRRLLNLMLPNSLQPRYDTPAAYVVFNRANVPPVSLEMIEALPKREAGESRNTGVPVVRLMPNYRFSDRDTQAIFFILDERSLSGGNLTFTSGQVRYLLQKRVPALPVWFVEGFIELFPSAIMEVSPQLMAADLPLEVRTRGESGMVTLRPMRWLTSAETAVLRKRSPRLTELPPLMELLNAKPADDDAAALRLWRSQAALFIRWSLDGSSPAPRGALWQLVTRSSSEPLTDEIFNACYGFSPTFADRHLAEYLHVAVRNPIHLLPTDMPAPFEVSLTNATPADVSRVQGTLQQLEINYIQQYQPTLQSKYVEQARNTLGRAYRQGERDPRLLALLGLTECDAGNDAAAQPYLEAAVQGDRLVRPRVYYELARILYSRTGPKDLGTKQAPADVARVLELLMTACLQAPPQTEVYALMAEVMVRRDGPMNELEFKTLESGLYYFHRDQRLIYPAALLFALHGYDARASELIEIGLHADPSPNERNRLLRLEGAMQAKRDKNTP